MIYIITALKIEAQAFVDKYKLSKNKSNDKISIVVSGLGKDKMYETASKLLLDMNDEDIFVNVGICGASTKYTIGDIIDNDDLICVDKAIDDAKKYIAVDMESEGFLNACNNRVNTYMFKIVSDHFEPHKVTKDKTKKLIYDKIDEIMKRLEK